MRYRKIMVPEPSDQWFYRASNEATGEILECSLLEPLFKHIAREFDMGMAGIRTWKLEKVPIWTLPVLYDR